MEYKFETLTIPSSRKTPEIVLDKENGVLKIIGLSIPENSKAFYEVLILWVNDYIKSPLNKTVVTIALRYMNSSTTMIINKVLKTLDQEIGSPNELVFEWLYEEDDYEMKDVGEYYQELLQHDVVFKEVEEI